MIAAISIERISNILHWNEKVFALIDGDPPHARAELLTLVQSVAAELMAARVDIESLREIVLPITHSRATNRAARLIAEAERDAALADNAQLQAALVDACDLLRQDMHDAGDVNRLRAVGATAGRGREP